jgi:hypothetical protein
MMWSQQSARRAKIGKCTSLCTLRAHAAMPSRFWSAALGRVHDDNDETKGAKGAAASPPGKSLWANAFIIRSASPSIHLFIGR